MALAKIILTAENQEVDMRSINSIDLSGDGDGSDPSLIDKLISRTKKDDTPSKVYSWVDEHGETHYSDKPQDKQKNTIR